MLASLTNLLALRYYERQSNAWLIFMFCLLTQLPASYDVGLLKHRGV